MTQAGKLIKGKFAPVPVPKPSGHETETQATVWQTIRGILGGYRLAVTTFMIVLAISAAYGVYVFAISSDLYISEARFALREAGDSVALNLMSGGSTGPSAAASEANVERSVKALMKGSGGDDDFLQNPFVIANFLMSQAFVHELQQKNWLEPRFARPSVDYFSRLPANATLEEAWRFWGRHAMAAVDRRSNVVVVKVWAFTPEDAQATADLMVKRGEALLNEIEIRGRTDALDRARLELDHANEEYTKKLGQISDMRQMLATVDPQTVATAAQNSLLRIEGERILMQRELQVLKAAENANSPAANVLRQRSQSIMSEVGQIQNRITGYEADVRAAVNAVAAYEELDINRRFALTRVQIASLAVESAELQLRTNSYFIYTFIAPSLPVLPSDRWRFEQWALVTSLAVLAWLATITFVTLSRDSRY